MEIEIYHVDQAINGSKEALEAIIENIEGPVFNLSLRMLGRIVTVICAFNIKKMQRLFFLSDNLCNTRYMLYTL